MINARYIYMEHSYRICTVLMMFKDRRWLTGAANGGVLAFRIWARSSQSRSSTRSHWYASMSSDWRILSASTRSTGHWHSTRRHASCW